MRTITGKARADFIRGGAFDEQISGLGGNDIIFAGGGNDTVSGGTGNDTIHGDAGNDSLKGDSGNDNLYGDAGNDTLAGGVGNDMLYGGTGNDVLSDTSGFDLFNGGAGVDMVDYSGLAKTRGVDVHLNLGIGGRDAAGDHYVGIEGATGTNSQDFLWGDGANNTLIGLGGNDFLRGFDGADVLNGGDGNDELYADGGNDILMIGSGDDIADGGAGFDWLDFSAEKSALDIDVGAGTFGGPLQPWGPKGGDQVYNVEGLRGTAFDDVLKLAGGFSFQVLDGGDGDDILSGAQTYYGGMGEDHIRLAPGTAESVALQLDKGYDHIVFFSTADGDKLQVSMSEFGLSGTTANPVYNWVNTTDAQVALTTGPAFIYEATTGLLWFDADGTSTAHAPVALAGFYGAANVPTQADLLFVA